MSSVPEPLGLSGRLPVCLLSPCAVQACLVGRGGEVWLVFPSDSLWPSPGMFAFNIVMPWPLNSGSDAQEPELRRSRSANLYRAPVRCEVLIHSILSGLRSSNDCAAGAGTRILLRRKHLQY